MVFVPRNARVSENTAIVQERLNGPAARAFQALSPGDQDRALQVRRSIHPGDNVAALAFDSLLAEGRLTSGPRDRQGRSLLEALDDVSRRPELPPAFLGDMVQELADPTSIRQEFIGTCAPATAQALVARTDPAEYVRVTGDLVTRGQAELRDGTTVKAAPGILPVPSMSPRAVGRSDSSVAFQDSMIQHFAGRTEGMGDETIRVMVGALTGRPWDATKHALVSTIETLEKRADLQALPDGKRLLGLSKEVEAVRLQIEADGKKGPVSPELSRKYDALYGRFEADAATFRQDHLPELGRAAVDRVVQAFDSGSRVVPFNFRFRRGENGGSHLSLLTGMRTTPTGRQEFTFLNPHGKEESFSREQLEKVIHTTFIPSR